jgi:hypothetical protein
MQPFWSLRRLSGLVVGIGSGCPSLRLKLQFSREAEREFMMAMNEYKRRSAISNT